MCAGTSALAQSEGTLTVTPTVICLGQPVFVKVSGVSDCYRGSPNPVAHFNCFYFFDLGLVYDGVDGSWTILHPDSFRQISIGAGVIVVTGFGVLG